jgi:hypothetical protein
MPSTETREEDQRVEQSDDDYEPTIVRGRE